MTQRQITHASGELPACAGGHAARHFHDKRRAPTGGHFIECECRASGKHPEYDDALREWCRLNGHPAPACPPQRALPLATVHPLLRAAR